MGMLGELRERLMRTDRVASAYLARKRVEHLADEAPLYVLGLVPDTKWWRLERTSDRQRMLEHALEGVELPGELLAVPLASENKWLRKRLEAVGGALVFAR